MASDVRLVDLDVIRRYSLALRQESAPAEEPEEEPVEIIPDEPEPEAKNDKKTASEDKKKPKS